MAFKTMTRRLEPEFQFAGFTFPKYVFTLPQGPMQKRLERARNRITGPYYHRATPNQNKGLGFYLSDSDGSVFKLRWEWCDDVAKSIGHTGWWTDEHGDSETMRGMVFRLSHDRGFLIGWSMGKGMASSIDTSYVYPDAVSAALAADDAAKYAAEQERKYQEEQGEADDDEH